MANHTIKSPEQFTDGLRKLETTDRNHADVFNALLEVLINNDAYLKKIADAAGAHMMASAVHVPSNQGAAAGSYLKSNGTWAVPPDTNTTYGSMGGASTNAAGKAGLVPAPAAGAATRYLRSDGTWQTPPDTNTTYSPATQTANGLMAAADKQKLDGIATGANVTPAGLISGYVQTGNTNGGTAGARATMEGAFNLASGNDSHAEGYGCTSSGKNSHSEGECTEARGWGSHSGGGYTIANGIYQTVIGKYNLYNSTSALFIIGNGSDTARSNALRVAENGSVFGQGAYQTSGADYGELFQYEDENLENEDRRGYFVTLSGDKIRKADASDDFILGIVSAKPVVVGNSDPDGWHGRFLTDEFGNYITEMVEQEIPILEEEEAEETYTDDDGKEAARTVRKLVEKTEKQMVESYIVNPDFDPNMPYIPRAERPEWALVGMLGQLIVRDDGTCEADGYCTCADGGIATKAESGYRVMERVTDHLVKIIFR